MVVVPGTMTTGRSSSQVEPSICQLFFAPLRAVTGRHLSLLDGAETARLEGFVRPVDRDRFVLAAVLLRVAAGSLAATSPEALRVDRRCPRCGTPHGRPRLPGSALHASIAHSGGLVAVALSMTGPVGIDVEATRDLDYEPFIDTICGPSERAWVRDIADFYTYWVRKEAVLKACGVGLSVPLTDLVVAPPPAAPAVRSYRRATLAAQMVDVAPAAGHACAAAVLTAEPISFAVREVPDVLDVTSGPSGRQQP